MTDKEKADIFEKLAGAAWEQFKNRRSYEWKMAFGVWTAYGAATGLLFRLDQSLPWWAALAATGIGAYPVYLFREVWMRYIKGAHGEDAGVQEFWEKELADLVGRTPPQRRQLTEPWHEAHVLQRGVTLAFFLLFVLGLWTRVFYGR